MADTFNIANARYPGYVASVDSWQRYRFTMAGGEIFKLHYLNQYTRRETLEDFLFRRMVTPVPGFAKAAINEIRNAIFQRTGDVVRRDGSESYHAAASGLNGGVDRRGSTMNAFIGMKLLTELLSMGRVGCFVDNHAGLGPRMSDTQGISPYLYPYPIEDILSYRTNRPDEPGGQFRALLLRDKIITYDGQTNLPIASVERMRRFWINEDTGNVMVQFHAENGDLIDADGNPGGGPIELELKRIPFVLFDIGDSLLKDVVDHQIALLNLGSSDVSYALKANFPFYTEQRDLRAGASHLVPSDTNDGTAMAGGQSNANEDVRVGTVNGRFYDQKMERPGFINPSAEPLRVSMELQEKLKSEIRELVNLAVMTLATRASAESKSMDNQGLEAGLSYIGLVLENGERQIADFWSTYEGKDTTAVIKYPDRYSLKTDGDRVDESEKLSELMAKVPGQTVKREIAKTIVQTLLGGKVSIDMISKIGKEIDEAPYTTSDPTTIQLAIESGLGTADTCSQALGFNKGEAEKAKGEHLERVAAIANAQGVAKGGQGGNPAARGVPDLAADPNAAKDEKAASRNTDMKATTEPPVRGEGK